MRYKCALIFSRNYLRLALIVLSLSLNIETVRSKTVDTTATPKLIPTPSTVPQSSAFPSLPLSKLLASPSPSEGGKNTGTVTLTIKQFRFVGNKIFSSKQLARLLTPFTNRPITFDDLREATSTITKFYAEHGYFKSYAYVPAQSFAGNELTLVILERGKREEVLSGWMESFPKKQADRKVLILDSLESGKRLTQNTSSKNFKLVTYSSWRNGYAYEKSNSLQKSSVDFGAVPFIENNNTTVAADDLFSLGMNKVKKGDMQGAL